MTDRLYIVKMETIVVAHDFLTAAKLGFIGIRNAELPVVFVTDQETKETKTFDSADVYSKPPLEVPGDDDEPAA
jgi:hypothetical protein